MYPRPYLHDDYAGGLEDLIVHSLLTLAIACRPKRGRGLVYVDTHAGAGAYHLARAKVSHGRAVQRSTSQFYEMQTGNAYASEYRRVLKRLNGYSRKLWRVPGSPAIARLLLPNETKFEFSETNEGVFRRLQRWSNDQGRMTIINSDGFNAALQALRSVSPESDYVFYIDPAYEVPEGLVSDYERIVELLSKASPIPSNVTIGITYPAATRDDFARLELALSLLPSEVRGRMTRAELRFCSRRYALAGAGLLVANATNAFETKARRALRLLSEHLHIRGARVWVRRLSGGSQARPAAKQVEETAVPVLEPLT